MNSENTFIKFNKDCEHKKSISNFVKCITENLRRDLKTTEMPI